jgi:DNA-binding MarR family transcriptional regulator
VKRLSGGELECLFQLHKYGPQTTGELARSNTYAHGTVSASLAKLRGRGMVDWNEDVYTINAAGLAALEQERNK